jgi:hypothetical protein
MGQHELDILDLLVGNGHAGAGVADEADYTCGL